MKQTTTLLSSATATGAGGAFSRPGATWNYLLAVVGSGAVAATVLIEVSYDGTRWLTWGTLDASGTADATDTLSAAIGSYPLHRARVTAISGTGAQASVMGSGE